MANDPFELPSPYAVLLTLLLGSVTAIGLVVYALTILARRGGRRTGMAVTLRSLAALTGGAAVAVYTWGALHLLMDETAADQACKAAVGPARAGDVDRYQSSFLPLRFGCHVESGGTYEAAVPGYVNPAVLGLVLLGVLLAALAAHEVPRPINTGNASS